MEMLTVKQIAERYSLHPETVRRWVKSGELEANKNKHSKGQQYLISEENLKEFLSK